MASRGCSRLCERGHSCDGKDHLFLGFSRGRQPEPALFTAVYLPSLNATSARIYIYIFSLISLHLWYVCPEELSLWKFFGSIDALIGRDATIRWKVMRVWREERKRIHSFPLKCLIDRGFIVTFFSSEKRKN